MRYMLSTHRLENMQAMHANDAAMFINTAIEERAEHCIAQRKLRERKSTHPWLIAEVEALAQQKLNAEGTPDERNAAEKCSAGRLANFFNYTRKCADKLLKLLPSRKAW